MSFALLCLVATIVLAAKPYCCPATNQSDANHSLSVAHNNQVTPAYTKPSESRSPRWYTPLKRPEWWLVILGFPTLFFVGWQAWESRKAANASRDSAEALVKSERAWVIADLIPMGYRNNGVWAVKWENGGSRLATTEEVLRGVPLRHRLSFTNMGRSAARIKGYQIHCGFFDHKRELLRIEHIQYNNDFERMIAGGGTTGILPETIDIHQFVSNPAAKVDSFETWMVVLINVTYEHIFTTGEPETALFRFAFDTKDLRMERRAVTEADQKQARKPQLYPTLGQN